ncbi:hypothetical protein A0J61_08435 [Choanephora cucurbitarum]|uniref:Uncharacterized protein n=1 Tax=Choanephora cucurbitarum TaxID=101091 RepID=A0A1C7N303_9FUNG|nr:hypothetical protein A0J61_08435 [Choanephora cucurbitarum]
MDNALIHVSKIIDPIIMHVPSKVKLNRTILRAKLSGIETLIALLIEAIPITHPESIIRYLVNHLEKCQNKTTE